MKILLCVIAIQEFGGWDKCPSAITGRIVEVEQHSMSEVCYHNLIVLLRYFGIFLLGRKSSQ